MSQVRLQCMALMVAAVPLLVGTQPRAQAATSPDFLLGLVSISASEANNARFIRGAEQEAAAKGWHVSVIDAQGSADQANSAMENLVQRKAGAIIDLVFPASSLGEGLAATTAAGIPVATWGGGLGKGVVATNGSGGPLAVPIMHAIVDYLGDSGSLLELTYHTGEVCRQREQVADGILSQHPGIKVTKDEVRIPGYFQDGAQYATAWLASHPAGSGKLAIWGCWDDPAIGAISALRQQMRQDVKVYGENGNAQAIALIQKGLMTATAWQNSGEEAATLVDTLADAIAAGASWKPKAVEVPPVVITSSNVDAFVKQHPDSVGR
jgi:ribose transport system substrate-binding protein